MGAVPEIDVGIIGIWIGYIPGISIHMEFAIVQMHVKRNPGIVGMQRRNCRIIPHELKSRYIIVILANACVVDFIPEPLTNTGHRFIACYHVDG